MGLLISSSGRGAPLGLVALRLAVGAVMLVAGWRKLFEFGVAGFGDALAAEGVPLPDLTAWGVTLLEFVGGVLLVVGLLARPTAALLAIDMVVAIVLVTHEIGFLSSSGRAGVEVNVLLIGGLAAIALGGAGPISLDRALEARAGTARRRAGGPARGHGLRSR